MTSTSFTYEEENHDAQSMSSVDISACQELTRSTDTEDNSSKDPPGPDESSRLDVERFKHTLVAKKYRLVRQIGGGGCGCCVVYLGKNIITDELVAVKLSCEEESISPFEHEATVLRSLAGGVGIPFVHSYGAELDYRFLVLDLLGPSLDDFLSYCGGRLSLKTVLVLLEQGLARLEHIHSNSVVHRDVNPEHLLMGVGKHGNQVNLIGFGQARKYRDPKTHAHIPYEEGRALIGSVWYASINVHLGAEYSPRDDLISLLYSIVDLYKGSLPWRDLEANATKRKLELIRDKKISTPLHVLCSDMPDEIPMLLQYAYCLGWKDEPDYFFLRRTVHNIFVRKSFLRDYVFDWTVNRSKELQQAQQADDQAATPPRLQDSWSEDDEKVLMSLLSSLKLESGSDKSMSTAADTLLQSGSILSNAAASIESPPIRETAETELGEHPKADGHKGTCHAATAVELIDVPRINGHVRQLEYNPISQDQLAAEVRNIHARLVELETQCRVVDAALKANPHFQLAPVQWQTLVELHRALMHEHYDFLMASQHPSAAPALLILAKTHNTPSRLWNHGIGPFLMILHHRGAACREYANLFTRLAYQMMGLLTETVPSFLGVWAEWAGNIGHIGLFTMPVSVGRPALNAATRRWYSKAKDQYPTLGRLAHRFAPEASPSLRELSLYTAALVSVVPYPLARGSLRELCLRVVRGADRDKWKISHAESCAILYHANAFLRYEGVDIGHDTTAGLKHTWAADAEDLHKWAVPLVVTNVSVLLEYGSNNNVLWDSLRNLSAGVAPLSNPATELHATSAGHPALKTTCSSQARETVYSSFISLLEHGTERERTVAVLPAIAIMLIWVHKLCTLTARTENFGDIVADSPLLPPSRFWDALAEFLNEVGSQQPIDGELVRAAYEGMIPFGRQDERSSALPEDRDVRGLRWAHDCFDLTSREDPQIKSPAMQDMDSCRRKRILSLGLRLSLMPSKIDFNPITQAFSTRRTADSGNVKSTSLQENSSSALPVSEAWQSANCDTESEFAGYDASISGLSQSDAAVELDTYDDFVFVRGKDEDLDGSDRELVEADE